MTKEKPRSSSWLLSCSHGMKKPCRHTQQRRSRTSSQCTKVPRCLGNFDEELCLETWGTDQIMALVHHPFFMNHLPSFRSKLFHLAEDHTTSQSVAQEPMGGGIKECLYADMLLPRLQNSKQAHLCISWLKVKAQTLFIWHVHTKSTQPAPGSSVAKHPLEYL